ncbi:MAG: hypothetical protein QXJ97_04860 [Desulfurococcaceae archaeon]
MVQKGGLIPSIVGFVVSLALVLSFFNTPSLLYASPNPLPIYVVEKSGRELTIPKASSF